jgi:hypothetical protein
MLAVWMLDYRRVLLWFIVLVLPGGLLLLPLLIADAGKRGWRKPKGAMEQQPVATLPRYLAPLRPLGTDSRECTVAQQA